MLTADDKLGMSLDEIIKRKGKHSNLIGKRGPRKQREKFKIRNRNKKLITRLQARSNIKSIGTGRVPFPRFNMRRSKPTVIQTSRLSLTTPQFRERQRRQSALVTLARRLTKRKIVQLQNIQRRPRLQAQPIFTKKNISNRNVRRFINPLNRRQTLVSQKLLQTIDSIINDNNTFENNRPSKRRYRPKPEKRPILLHSSNDGERRFVSRQLADVAADRFTRRRFSENRHQQSSYVMPKFRNNRRRNFDDGRSVFRRTPANSSSIRRIKAERQYDRFYSDDEPETARIGSLYADKLTQRGRRVNRFGDNRSRKFSRKYNDQYASNSNYDIYRSKRRFF